jgi:predicted amino acid racemase
MEVIFALGRAAVGINRTHRIVVMIDTGDGREGVAPEAAIPFIRDAGRISGIEVAGVGTNFTCLRGKAPDKENLSVLAGIAGQAAEEIGPNGITVSGGNSSAWNMLRDGRIPPEVNELRMGEALLLGRETARGELIEGFCHDAFAIEAEVIEAPPSRPGHFIAAVGRQDIDEGSLFPADSETEIVKASSDHLVLRRGGTAPAAGETVRFVPGYDSLLRVMTSPYVRKEYI